MNELKPEDVMDNHTKEKVICPWCKEEMRPYPHQGYYWFECKCGARTPKLWHATQEQTREKALSYAALLREKDAKIAELQSIAEHQQSSNMKRYFELKEKDKQIAEKDSLIEMLSEDRMGWADEAVKAQMQVNEKGAEIERLQAEISRFSEALFEKMKTARAEAITEFAERLKQASYADCTITGYRHYIVDVADIDQIAKEMGGGANAEAKDRATPLPAMRDGAAHGV